MARRAELSAEQQVMLGTAVAKLRAENVPWKIISREYGFGKTRLWQFQQAAKAAGKSVHEHMTAGQNETTDNKVVTLRRSAAG